MIAAEPFISLRNVRKVYRSKGAEFLADQSKCVWPVDRHIMVCVRVVHHRMSNPTLFLEPVVGPPGKLGYRMLGEEFGR